MSGAEVAIIAGLGAAGALVRWAVTAWATSDAKALIVVAVNTLGSLGAGVSISANWGPWATLLAVGLWGSLTTLSTLAVDVVERSEHRGVRRGLGLLLLHLIGGVLGVSIGLWWGGLISAA